MEIYLPIKLKKKKKQIYTFHAIADDQLYEQLSFREILVVGKLENALYASQPDSIGGLCLDVQVVRGSQPARRINPAKDEEIAPKLVQELGKKLEDVKKDHPSMRSFPGW